MAALSKNSSSSALPPLTSPGKSEGLLGVFKHRYLLRLIVKKDLQVRYQGSVLGIIWSYIKPAVQFLALYIALGVFLGQNDRIPNYAVYLFSGIILINFFSEAMGNASRSVVRNSALIKKVYLPRELFPVSTIWVAIVHFFPQLVVLIIACLVVGWHPNPIQLLAALAGFMVVALYALGLGLFFSSINVFFRDAENIVDLILMVANWFSPVIYMFSMVREHIDGIWLILYQLNPVTIAVELFHLAFWSTTWDDSMLHRMYPQVQGDDFAKLHETFVPPENLLTVWLPASIGVMAVVLIIGEVIFRRLEGRFAQEI